MDSINQKVRYHFGRRKMRVISLSQGRSEDQGSYGTLPYGIPSFNLQLQLEEDQGTCWVFAMYEGCYCGKR